MSGWWRTKLALNMCGWVCKGEQLHVCVSLLGAQQVTIRNHDKHTLTTIYNLSSSPRLYTSVTSRMLTLASVVDITGGLELTRMELWISNSNVSQVSIGFYTPLRPNSPLDFGIFALCGWNYNLDWLRCRRIPGRLLCNSRMSAK